MKLSILDHSLLSEEETQELIRMYQSGNSEAANRVIEHNQRAIYRIAMRYYHTRVCGDATVEDLMQWGAIGMLRAMKDFDPSRGKFITYAWSWVRMYISRHGVHDGQSISISYQASQKRARLGKIRHEFIAKNHREPTSEELTEKSGIPLNKVLTLRSNVISLESRLLKADKLTLEDIIQSSEKDPAEIFEEKEITMHYIRRVESLPKRSQKIIRMLYGLDGKQPASMREVAECLHITHQRVQQIRDKSLEILREEQ